MANPALLHTRRQPSTVPFWSTLATWWTEERILVLALVLLGLVMQGLNMFHFPDITRYGDEGIYAMQGWAVIKAHQLAFYTYFYDHSPVGWLLIAIWYLLTNGIHTFGNVIDSGRVLILLLNLATIPILYRLIRKLGGDVGSSWLGVAILLISPLAIPYRRLLLLDNIMVFWLLISLDLLLDGQGRLSRIALSGLCFALAILSKETAIFLIPAMLYIVWQQRWEHQGRFTLFIWLMLMVAVVSIYPLYALLNGELFPSDLTYHLGPFTFNTGTNHVSLLGSLLWQISRGGGGMFNLQNNFWTLMRMDWLPRDPFLLLGGIAAIVLNMFRGVRNRQALAAGLLGISSLYYMLRGGVVFDFYIPFLLPFLCINLALIITPFYKLLSERAVMSLVVTVLTFILLFHGANIYYTDLFTSQPDQAARAAISWVKQNVAPDSVIVLDDSFWLELHEPGPEGQAFPNVQSHWKVALDPAIRDKLLHKDWRNVDYVLVIPGFLNTLKDSNDTITLDALAHSHIVWHWQAGSDYVELYQVDHTMQSTSLLANP